MRWCSREGAWAESIDGAADAWNALPRREDSDALRKLVQRIVAWPDMRPRPKFETVVNWAKDALAKLEGGES